MRSLRLKILLRILSAIQKGVGLRRSRLAGLVFFGGRGLPRSGLIAVV